MIIDYKQSKGVINVSYVDDFSRIITEDIVTEFFEFTETSEYDIDKLPNVTSFTGKPVKKIPAKFFEHHAINEFFVNTLPNEYPDFYKRSSGIKMPNPFSVDIEVLPTDEYGYSEPDVAENPVTSIAICDKDFGILYFEVNPALAEQELDKVTEILVKQQLRETLGNHYPENLQFICRFFKTEFEMLNIFIEYTNKYFHFQIGLNFLQYDWQYIFNRCVKLGISPKKASPINKLSKTRIEINDKTTIELEVPTHRILTSYDTVFKDSLVYSNLTSYSLEALSELILGLSKVSYDGNLRTLYNSNHPKFIAYNIVDTILVMLIHLKTSLINVEFFQSIYTKIPFNRLSQNAISEALVHADLLKYNKILLKSEKSNNPHRNYPGGYVKNPVIKHVESTIGIDAKSLYPNAMILGGLSPESKAPDVIKVDENYMPLNDFEMAKWNEYKKLGYCLSPTGRMYDVTKDYLFTRIEKSLIAERELYREHQDDIYLDIIPKLEAEMKRRGITIPKH